MFRNRKSIQSELIPETWGTRVGLVLAMAGNAVGFGNFLRFPVQAVQNGGGAFIIPYLVSLVILGIPLLLIEWSSGRFGGQFGHHSTPFILHKMNKKAIWKYVGVFGIFSNIAIASYYCYMESWTLSYVFHSIIGTFDGMDQNSVAGFFDNYLDLNTSSSGIPYEAIFFFVFCLALNIWILSKGLSGGVEKAAKIGVPLLIVFGIFLVYRAMTLKAGTNGALFDGLEGLNFLWTPKYDSLTNPKVWLAAAGQIFFTLSVGMGSIQCYASYLKEKDDVALNSMSAGFMNEFVEIVLGGSIIIPIAVGYLGIDKVIELTNLGGLGLAFRTMPFLFEQWGTILSALGGLAFFGLLFFAGITSSLAMGTPVMGFLKDEFNINKKPAALIFGLLVLIFGLPTVFFFQEGVFDEYDYWAGTISLFVFAMLESVLFAWFFGASKGWDEITRGAEIKIPVLFKFLIRYVTPVVLIIVFTTSLIRPENDNWAQIKDGKWSLHKESILGQLQHKGIGPNKSYFSNTFYSETNGFIDSVWIKDNKQHVRIIPDDQIKNSEIVYISSENASLLAENKSQIEIGQAVWEGKVINKIFYKDMARLLLLSLFLGIAFAVWYAFRKRKKEELI